LQRSGKRRGERALKNRRRQRQKKAAKEATSGAEVETEVRKTLGAVYQLISLNQPSVSNRIRIEIKIAVPA